MGNVTKFRRKRKHSESHWDHDGEFDVEATIELNRMTKTEYAAPKAEQKWRIKNLIAMHWKLTFMHCPQKSYLRVLYCLIDHANSENGRCDPGVDVMAIETGYSARTVRDAIRWAEDMRMLQVERRGLGKTNAYHIAWDALEQIWLDLAETIKADKQSLRGDGQA
jgi:hypothetical protein